MRRLVAAVLVIAGVTLLFVEVLMPLAALGLLLSAAGLMLISGGKTR
jgi:membrane-bound ClpP family serine protease